MNKLFSGERKLTLALLLLSMFCVYLSRNMFIQEPIPSGFGSFPLFVSSIFLTLMVLQFLSLIRGGRKARPSDGEDEAVPTALPGKTRAVFFLLMLYVLAIAKGWHFMVVTAVFLFLAMSCLMPKQQWSKNLITIGAFLLLIFVLFRLIFRIELL